MKTVTMDMTKYLVFTDVSTQLVDGVTIFFELFRQCCCVAELRILLVDVTHFF